MSMVLTRSPLEPIGMNGGTAPRRRSARLSAEGAEENEPPAKRNKANGVHTQTVSTKEQDGDAGAASKKKKRGKTFDAPGEKALRGSASSGVHVSCCSSAVPLRARVLT